LIYILAYKMNKRTNNLTLSAMFITMGILIPIVFHAIGLSKIFLPMFWPVAASIFFLPVPFAAMVGVLTPILSFLLTGMPPISPPILYRIITELLFLTLCTSLLYRKTKFGIIFSLLVGLLGSRVIMFLGTILLRPFYGFNLQKAIKFAYVDVLSGMAGVIIILILVPFLINRIKHESLF